MWLTIEKMHERTHCTVVVCTRNRPESLSACLASLAGQRVQGFQVLVVDSAPADSRGRDVANRFSAQYLLEEQAGLSRARNAGLRSAAGAIVAFLDDDCVADSQWLESLLREFSDPRVAAVTGNIFMPGPEFAGERKILDRSHRAWFEMAHFGGIGSGGNMAFRRGALPGGFDERLGRGAPLAAGEANLAFSAILEARHRIVYTPQAVVTHPRQSAAGFQAIASVAACFTMLLVESPYRGKALRYCLEALAGYRREWRFAGNGQASGRPWWTPFAMLAGPFLYFNAARTDVPVPEPLRAIDPS